MDEKNSRLRRSEAEQPNKKSAKRQGDQPGKPWAKVAIISGAILLLLLAGFLTACALAAPADKVLPRATVAGIDIGGMSYAEVQAALKDAQDTWSNQQDAYVLLEVAGGDGQPIRVYIPARYMELDSEATASKVWEAARVNPQQNFAQKGGRYLSALVSKTTVAPVYADGGQLDDILKTEVDDRIGQELTEHSYVLEAEALVVTKGLPGLGVDRNQIKQDMMDLLAEGKTVGMDAQEAQITTTLGETQPKELDFQAVLEEVRVEPQDAFVNLDTAEVHKEVYGISFDVAAAQQAYDSLAWGESGNVTLIITEPAKKLTDLTELLYRDVLGTCTTSIGGTSNRLSNVKKAADLSNEIILQPGEEYSYNGVVGRRTSERGFLPAPAYVGGKTVDEIGGGICQVSSTVYLATLRANLEIVERHNHGFTVGYVPNGLDATVYYGSLDYRFKNNTDFPIKIVSQVKDRSLTVTIYGTNLDKTSVEMETVQTGSTGYKTVYKTDSSLSAGKTKVSVTPYSGCTVKSYRCVYKDGQLVSRELEATSTYRSRDKVVLVSPADGYKYGLGGSAPADNSGSGSGNGGNTATPPPADNGSTDNGNANTGDAGGGDNGGAATSEGA